MKKDGFTLLEIVIVLGVIGILLAFLGPQLYTYFIEVKGESITQTTRTLKVELAHFWAQHNTWPLDNDPEPTVLCGNDAEGDPDLLGDARLSGEEGEENGNNNLDDGLFYNKRNTRFIDEKDLPIKSVTGGIILYRVDDVVAVTATGRDDVAIVFTVCPDSTGHEELFRLFDKEYDKKPDWHGAKKGLVQNRNATDDDDWNGPLTVVLFADVIG